METPDFPIHVKFLCSAHASPPFSIIFREPLWPTGGDGTEQAEGQMLSLVQAVPTGSLLFPEVFRIPLLSTVPFGGWILSLVFPR